MFVLRARRSRSRHPVSTVGGLRAARRGMVAGVYPVVLDGEAVLLREFRSSDARAAYGWVSDPEAVRYVPLGPLDELGAAMIEQLGALVGRR